MTAVKSRIPGTLHLRAVTPQGMQTQSGVKFTLAARSRDAEQRFVRAESRIWSMKH